MTESVSQDIGIFMAYVISLNPAGVRYYSLGWSEAEPQDKVHFKRSPLWATQHHILLRMSPLALIVYRKFIIVRGLNDSC